MVSQLSVRLLGGSNDSNSGSSKGSSQKRSTQISIEPESSLSGYSADQEGRSISPPVISIDFDGRDKEMCIGEDRCPKRQRRNKQQFAVSTIKVDLDKAGKEFPAIVKDLKKTTCLGKFSIDLKGVKLLYSKEVTKPFVTSNISAQTSLYDYESLVSSCWESYASSFGPLKQHDQAQYSDRSTSSVSDAESDSVDSNSNLENQTFLIPPLLDDFFNGAKQAPLLSSIEMNSCNVISNASNAVTMSEILQLSDSARLVALSVAPFTIVHANGAFFKFSKASTTYKILGAPFSSILDPNQWVEPVPLSEYMVASSKGNHKNVFLKQDSSGKAVECRMKVSPIVARKTANREVSTVTHFAIELTNDDLSSRRVSPHTTVENAAMGVMG